MSHKKGHYGVYKKKDNKPKEKKLSRDAERGKSRKAFLDKEKERKASQAKVNSLKKKTARGLKSTDASMKAQDAHDKKYGLGKYKKVTAKPVRYKKGDNKKSSDSKESKKTTPKKVTGDSPKTNTNNKAKQNVTSSKSKSSSKVSNEKRESLIDKIRKAGEASKARREKEGYVKKMKRTSSGFKHVYVKKKK